LNELISHCVYEVKRLNQDKIESAPLVITSISKGKGLKRKKDKEISTTS